MTKLPTLYHEGKSGKLYSWSIWSEGADIVAEYGTVEGEKSLTRKTAKGKNAGKANETTPEEQAVKEIKAQWKKKLKKKYSETEEQAREIVFLPMLANNFLKLKKPITYPVDVQRKLEGIRCLAHWEKGNPEVSLMSRGGEPLNIKHISDELKSLLPKGVVLDGEIYSHGLSQQQVNRLWKKHKEVGDPECPGGSIQLELRAYDTFTMDGLDVLWLKRRENLAQLNYTWMAGAKHINMLPYDTIYSEEELFEKLDQFEKEGYEGAIIRKHDGLYELGFRSDGLRKLKNFMDEEFTIISHGEADGNDKGTVLWVCENKDGNEFGVRPMGTRERRREYFEHATEYYDRWLTVKFQSYTDDNIPQFPVGVAIREPEDM